MSSDSKGKEDVSFSSVRQAHDFPSAASTVKGAKISNSYKQSYKSSWETEPGLKTWLGWYRKDRTQALLQIVQSKIEASEKCTCESHQSSKTCAKFKRSTFKFENCIVFLSKGKCRKKLKRLNLFYL